MRIGHVTKTYSGRTVLDVASLCFAPCRVYAILGSNGSGKSTLLRILAGLLAPDRGSEMELDRAQCAYMPQKSYAFSLRADRNALLGANGRDAEARAASYFAALSMTARMKQNAAAFSGGETAKLALIRTMMTGRKILLLDEPTAAMDVPSVIAAEALLREYPLLHGGTVVLVTHAPQQARRVADEVLFLHEGRCIARGAPEDVLSGHADARIRQFAAVFGE